MTKIFFLFSSLLLLNSTVCIAKNKSAKKHQKADCLAKKYCSKLVSKSQIDFPEGFDLVPNAKFKLDYFHTDGYSNFDRHWHEVIILDSLLILNFHSPSNYDWNYIAYQKQEILSTSTLEKIKQTVKIANLTQLKFGFPDRSQVGSGYGGNKLFIATEDINLAGGDLYMCIGSEDDQKDYDERIAIERQQSTTLSGNYESVFFELESLFPDLEALLKSMSK